ncbi:MAG: archaetidylserine decarboxylase [Rudaea sp.]
MRFSLLLQYALPHRLLSRIVYHATRWTWGPWKNWLISTVVRNYRVDMSEAEQPDPCAYTSFNAFFTRALKPGARTFPADTAAIVCPADGRISQSGRIRDGRILQAKGRDFSVAELFGDDRRAAEFANGSFITVYLSPRDYHRVHAPLTGTLRQTVHVPGRLFSVAPFAVAGVPRLFARNERLLCHFEGDHGPFVVAMVGAMLVSGIETVWNGVEIPPYSRTITERDWRERSVRLQRGEELGRFNMGSTVIVLLPESAGLIDPDLAAEAPVRMGQAIGKNP